MTRGLTKLEDEMKLMLEAALGILGDRPARLPAEVLWKHLARDLLRRIDEEILPRHGAPHVPPHQRPVADDPPPAGSERDAAGTHNSLLRKCV